MNRGSEEILELCAHELVNAVNKVGRREGLVGNYYVYRTRGWYVRAVATIVLRTPCAPKLLHIYLYNTGEILAVYDLMEACERCERPVRKLVLDLYAPSTEVVLCEVDRGGVAPWGELEGSTKIFCVSEPFDSYRALVNVVECYRVSLEKHVERIIRLIPRMREELVPRGC